MISDVRKSDIVRSGFQIIDLKISFGIRCGALDGPTNKDRNTYQRLFRIFLITTPCRVPVVPANDNAQTNQQNITPTTRNFDIFSVLVSFVERK